MVVELDERLAQQASSSFMEVLGICAFGAIGRHRIVANKRDKWDAWAQALVRDRESGALPIIDTLRTVWDLGEQGETLGRHDRIRVVPVASHPDEFTPSEALTLLGYPLRVLLENGRNDRDFLLAFADPPTLRALKDAEEHGWLLFETAGGITEVVFRIERMTEHRVERRRTFCTTDSDARSPGKTSKKAREVQRAIRRLAERANLAPDQCGRVLRRRAAENYVPPRALREAFAKQVGHPEAGEAVEAWKKARAGGSLALPNGLGRPGSPRRRLLAALAIETADPRVVAHLDFDSGRGDAGERTEDDVWRLLRPLEMAALKDGIGKAAIRGFYATAQHLPDETGEIQAILGTVLERL